MTKPLPEGRPFQFRVRVSKVERETVLDAVRISGLGRSAWIRDALIDCALEEIEGAKVSE